MSIGKRLEGTPRFYAEPLTGFRTWRMTDDEVLTGCVYGVVWPVDEDASAICEKGSWPPKPSHRANDVPVKDCMDGFYGYWTYADLQKQSSVMAPINTLRGAAIGWGKAWVAEHGWRAKYARPVAFLRWPGRRRNPSADAQEPEDVERAMHWNEVAERIAGVYSAPLVDHPEELADLARQYVEACR